MADDFGFTLRNFDSSSKAVSNSFQKLSSGKRINKAADDPAGLAIAAALQSDAATLSIGSQNVSYSQSANDIAGSSLEQIGNLSDQLASLAQQASNGTLNDSQRQTLNLQYQQLSQEITRVTQTTEFNGTQLLQNRALSTQVGTSGDANARIEGPAIDGPAIAASVASQDISTIEGARSAVDAVTSLVSALGQAQGQIGASSARLEAAQANNEVQRENNIAAASRIEDLDYAIELSHKVSNEIKQKTGLAIQASANQSAENVLRLLKT